MQADQQLPIVPRKEPDFGLEDADLPVYWFGNDPFKTRFFDAMSCQFPDGEKFFINCVRDYREQIDDPELKARVKDFIYQEAQHGAAHKRYNDRLQRQGIRVDVVVKRQNVFLGWLRRKTPPVFTLAQTAAAEHLTAIMAHGFMNNAELFRDADPRMRALYYWHAIEEIEHKAVAYDVLTNVARAGWLQRCFALFYVSILFPLETFLIMRHMFARDGVKQRWKVWLKGLWWMYGPGGLFLRILPHYFSYYRPGFHPHQQGDLRAQHRWLDTFNHSGGDAIAAADQVMADSLHRQPRAAGH